MAEINTLMAQGPQRAAASLAFLRSNGQLKPRVETQQLQTSFQVSSLLDADRQAEMMIASHATVVAATADNPAAERIVPERK